MFRTFARGLALFLVLALGLAGCERQSPPAKAPLQIQLNWKPEPQFGGFYSAQLNGAFARHGVNVDVVAGGTGTPTIQMVGAGRAEFGIVSADELIIARARGNNVVALMAVYQTCPQGIMTRASRAIENIGDVFSQPGTIGMQRGLPYSTFLERKYGFEKVTIVPSPGGDLTSFRNDEKFAQQCFITSEPIAAKQLGLDTKTFLIADAGYNPYTTVLVTHDEFLRKNPEVVEKVVAAVREGWAAYLSDPSTTNARMRELNPTMDEATFAAAAEAQKPLIETSVTREQKKIGWMTTERWETLAKQLLDMGAIESPPDVAGCFMNP